VKLIWADIYHPPFVFFKTPQAGQLQLLVTSTSCTSPENITHLSTVTFSKIGNIMKFPNAVSSFLVLLICFITVTWAYDKAMLRSYFKCEPCDESLCDIPDKCPGVIVKEPGLCSCCYTCARLEGEPCGVFTEKCAPGLHCQPLTRRKRSPEWNSLFKGSAICLPKPDPLDNLGEFDFDKW